LYEVRENGLPTLWSGSEDMPHMKVALVHDWLTGMRGGEKCLEVFCELWPDADLFTLVHVPGSVSAVIERHRIITSLVQRLPGSARGYRYYLPLMPTAIESLDLSPYDLVLSSSHCVAKGAISRPDALHVAYIHAPMRYVWDLWPLYFPPHGRLTRALIPLVLNYLRTWDVASAQRVDRFVANSHFVARRIAKYYRREAAVIYPPVDTAFFTPGQSTGDYYLMVTALVPYKGVDLAIQAFNALRRPLKIIGSGPLAAKLRAMAGTHVELLGWRSNEELRQYYAACRAVIFPAPEDFGIVPLEANAAGRPVIALGQGGALETVRPANDPSNPGAVLPHPGTSPAPTGVLFFQRTPEALQAAVRFFEAHAGLFNPAALRCHAQQFDRSVFTQRLQQFLAAALVAHGAAQRSHGGVWG
jgi:glycosyltransferase involved in cell wall biosynthesis